MPLEQHSPGLLSRIATSKRIRLKKGLWGMLQETTRIYRSQSVYLNKKLIGKIGCDREWGTGTWYAEDIDGKLTVSPSRGAAIVSLLRILDDRDELPLNP